MHDGSSLFHRIAQGDAQAVETCIERYGGLVWHLARRHLSAHGDDQGDAEDAVQEIFTSLWRTAGRYDPARSSEATFVSMIARRRLVDRWRQRARQPTLVDADALEIAGTDGDGEQAAEFARVRAILSELPADQYRVIHLSLWLGLSHGAIATRTGLPLGTVKSHLRRGLTAVRERLGVHPDAAAGGGRHE